MQQSLRIKIDRVTYANQTNGFVVIRGKGGTSIRNTQDVTAVGILPDAMSTTDLVGMEYMLQGDWKADAKYGRQFSFASSQMVGSQLHQFLAKLVKGLGESMAKDLVDHYGEGRLVEILDKDPEILLEFKGIKEKKLARIKASWEKQKCLRELSDYLLPAGVTSNMLVRVYTQFGADAVRKVKENPYSLTEITGIGFKTADNVARKLDIAFDSPFRIQAAIIYVLYKAADDSGHTCMSSFDLCIELREILDTDTEKVSNEAMEDALYTLAAMGNVIVDEAGVSIASYRHMERWLLKFFQSRCTGNYAAIASPEKAEQFIARSQHFLGFKFSADQKNVICRIGAGKSRVYALLGYAGTGKSTISRAILDFLSENFCRREDIVCCAFTGMAATRIKKLTGYPSFTIHTLLKYQGDNNFAFNKDNRLPFRVILLDEASMVNLPLFYRLAQAIADDALFLMVGDPAQLPPIGAGNVFCDITASTQFPKTILTAIFRQDENSVLVHFANQIRKGEVPDGYAKAYSDYRFILQDIPNYFTLKKEKPEEELRKLRDANNEKIRDKIKEIASAMVAQLSHPAWDFQVLTPMRKGILGAETLNPALQGIFNPSGRNPVEAFGITLREGDKVVHLRNQDMETVWYHPHILEGNIRDYRKQRVFNGSVGLIMKIDHENEEFFVLYPGQLLVRYEFDHIQHLIDLAYCLTVHKAQGSQYRVVALPLSNSSYMMLNNKWFYTALTRAESVVFLVGQIFAFRRASTNIDTTKRVTFLSI
jgi:exodeoxyribonuclease V alpha subunit